MSSGPTPFIGEQLLTLGIPLGAFLAGLLWLFFQRRPRT